MEQCELVNVAPSLIISAAHVDQVLSSLPVGSAAGSSGWTYKAIKVMFFDIERYMECLMYVLQ